jgi:DNA-binding NarL/FixJ family response regulator
MAVYRIVLADDHQLFRQGLKKIIKEKKDLKIVGEVSAGLELRGFLKKTPPDMVIMEIAMPDLKGIKAIREVKLICPHVKVLILTMHKNPEYLRHSLEAGADGYLLKEAPGRELFSAIQKIRKGKIYVSQTLAGEMPKKSGKRRVGDISPDDRLTPRERGLLKLISEGKSNREMAGLLSLSVRTVEFHRSTLMKKLGIQGAAKLTKYALLKGYTSVND